MHFRKPVPCYLRSLDVYNVHYEEEICSAARSAARVLPEYARSWWSRCTGSPGVLPLIPTVRNLSQNTGVAVPVHFRVLDDSLQLDCAPGVWQQPACIESNEVTSRALNCRQEVHQGEATSLQVEASTSHQLQHRSLGPQHRCTPHQVHKGNGLASTEHPRVATCHSSTRLHPGL